MTRQICGQRSSVVAGSKRPEIHVELRTVYFSVQICYMFSVSKCRGESDLGVCMTSGLTKRMPLRSGAFRCKHVFGCKIRQKSPLRSGILFASPEVMHTPRSSPEVMHTPIILLASTFKVSIRRTCGKNTGIRKLSVYGKLVDNFIHESDVTSLQDPFTSRPYKTPFYFYYCVPHKI